MNKCGKLSARAPRTQKARAFIPKLISESNTKVHATEEIADQFRKYYISLYNLSHLFSDREKSSEHGVIRDYLQNSKLPSLSDEAVAALEALLSSTVVALEMAWMQPGKAPGPDGYSLLY